MNYLLSREYDLQYNIPIIGYVDIDEVDLSLQESFFKALKRDIACSDISDKEELELYPYDTIIDYINQAKDLCISELNAFEIGKDFVNPQLLFVNEE